MSLILIIDDENSILENLQFNLELYGFDIIKARNGIEGMALFKKHTALIDAVITDMKMPGLSGMDIIRGVLDIHPDMGIIVLTGHGDTDNAVTAMSEGAFYYLQKPFSVENLVFILKKAIQKKDLLMENKKLQEDLIMKNRYLEELHDSAQRLLMNFVPAELPPFQLIDSAWIYKSCEKVGGDMFDVFETSDFLFFYIFDVCSHGILAAVNAIMIKAYLFKLKQYLPSASIEKSFAHDFSELNLELCKNPSSLVFATLFAGCIDKRTKRLHYASAGHIDQYLVHNHRIIPLSSTGTVLGTFENAAFTVNQQQLQSGDMILLFTDGVTDSWKNHSVIAQDEVLKIIRQNKKEPVKMIINTLDEAVGELTGNSPDDDMTILGIQLK